MAWFKAWLVVFDLLDVKAVRSKALFVGLVMRVMVYCFEFQTKTLTVCWLIPLQVDTLCQGDVTDPVLLFIKLNYI